MVAIQITQDSAKEMAGRLRQFLAAGGNSIKQTHAYEALATTLGYRDWNTLAAQLADPGSAKREPTTGADATAPTPPKPRMLLVIDRIALGIHGVRVDDIEAGFRREFPELLNGRTEQMALTHVQLPLRQMPKLDAPFVSLVPQNQQPPHRLMEALGKCLADADLEPMTVQGSQDGRLVLALPPERGVNELLPVLRGALAQLPPELLPVTVEKFEPGPDHPVFSAWQSDRVPYFIWEWPQAEIHFEKVARLAHLTLKLEGDKFVRLRDVATLHVLFPAMRGG